MNAVLKGCPATYYRVFYGFTSLFYNPATFFSLLPGLFSVAGCCGTGTRLLGPASDLRPACGPHGSGSALSIGTNSSF